MRASTASGRVVFIVDAQGARQIQNIGILSKAPFELSIVTDNRLDMYIKQD